MVAGARFGTYLHGCRSTGPSPVQPQLSPPTHEPVGRQRSLPVEHPYPTSERSRAATSGVLAIGLTPPDQGPDGEPETRGDQKTAAPDMMENDDIDQTDRCHADS